MLDREYKARVRSAWENRTTWQCLDLRVEDCNHHSIDISMGTSGEMTGMTTKTFSTNCDETNVESSLT